MNTNSDTKPMVLVTGGAGFIAMHCILKLLREGYSVRTTLRDLSREAAVRAMLQEGGMIAGDRLTFIKADLSADENWNEAVKDCAYVMHVASPTPKLNFKHEDEMIIPAREGVLRVLRASRLRAINPATDGLLAFTEAPGKIDLASFMEQNFQFNLPLEKFGYLTGRSLTTFKKDFKNTFQSSPGRWLTEKRLELAHYQLTEQHRRPSEVYLDAGFEDLSHFSFAFKKHFGYPPSKCAMV